MGSLDWWEFLLLFKGHWQSLAWPCAKRLRKGLAANKCHFWRPLMALTKSWMAPYIKVYEILMPERAIHIMLCLIWSIDINAVVKDDVMKLNGMKTMLASWCYDMHGNTVRITLGIEIRQLKTLNFKMSSAEWQPFFSQPQCVNP